MKKIITINHEYGSGGRLIGKTLAEKLGLHFYDKELIALTAQKSGFTEEFVKEAAEKKTASLLYSLYMTSLPISDQLFLAQSQVIKELAAEGSCVIVGSCADYILREERCFKVFVHAPREVRLKRVKEEHDVQDHREFLHKQDKKRTAYYNYFTQNKWGNALDYTLTVDSQIGINTAAECIARAAEAFFA